MTDDDLIRVWAISRYYHPNFSGAATQAHQILQRLARQGFSITVLAAADHLARDLAGQEARLNGVLIRYLPVVRRRDWSFLARFHLLLRLVSYVNGLLSFFVLSLRVCLVLWREGRRGDVVQFYSVGDFSLPVISLARMRGMHPVVRMSLLGLDDPGSFRGGVWSASSALKMGAFRRAEAVVGTSSALIDSCRSVGIDAGKVVRIPNGVDLDLFRPLGSEERTSLKRALGLQAERRHIIFVGSAKHRKGIDILTRAFIRIAQCLDDVELLIVGPSDFGDRSRHAPARRQLITELQHELERAGCSSRVHWLGRVDNVHAYLQAADLFCLPTRREGLPNAVMEAMAAGLPVVAAHLEGVTTDLVLSAQEGILIPGDDPQQYAEALLGLLADPARAQEMGSRARARIVREFGGASVAQRYATLYQALVEGKYA
jgi:glycosyltransferase involved in cell wall biosynthesis